MRTWEEKRSVVECSAIPKVSFNGVESTSGKENEKQNMFVKFWTLLSVHQSWCNSRMNEWIFQKFKRTQIKELMFPCHRRATTIACSHGSQYIEALLWIYILLPCDRPYTRQININDITSLAFQIRLFVNDATADSTSAMARQAWCIGA